MPRIAGQVAREDVTNSSLCGALADNPLTPPPALHNCHRRSSLKIVEIHFVVASCRCDVIMVLICLYFTNTYVV